MADIYEQAKNLADKILNLKAELQQAEDDYRALIYQIQHENLTSPNYYLSDQKTRKVNADFFRENMPEYFRNHARVSHSYAAHIMSKIHGGEQKFQAYLMEMDCDEFSKYATITVTDVVTDFHDRLDELKESGAITESVREYSIKPKLLFQIMQEQGVVKQ